MLVHVANILQAEPASEEPAAAAKEEEKASEPEAIVSLHKYEDSLIGC